jgi:hypothetical protein
MLDWIKERLGLTLSGEDARKGLMCWYAIHKRLLQVRLCPVSQHILRHGLHTMVAYGTRTDN